MIRLRRVQKTIGVKMGGEVLLAISPSRLRPPYIGVDSVMPGLKDACHHLYSPKTNDFKNLSKQQLWKIGK